MQSHNAVKPFLLRTDQHNHGVLTDKVWEAELKKLAFGALALIVIGIGWSPPTASMAATECRIERYERGGGYSLYSVCTTTTQMQNDEVDMVITYTLIGHYQYA